MLTFVACLITLCTSTVPDVSNDSLHVTVVGSGEPVVFIPGMIGSEFAYREVVSRLDASRYRSIIIEPLGVGSSPRPDGADYSLTAQADRIAALLDALVDEPAWFVAHSVSASIVYRLAYRRPGLVRGIVSLEGGPTESLSTPGFRFAMKFVPVFRMMGPRAIMGLMRQQMAKASADDAWITEETILGYTAGYQRNFDESLNALRAMSRTEEPERLVDNLMLIRCPVVLVLGAAPHASGPSRDDVEILQRGISDFAVEHVEGAGHFVHEENPDAVVAVLRRLTEGRRAL